MGNVHAGYRHVRFGAFTESRSHFIVPLGSTARYSFEPLLPLASPSCRRQVNRK